MELLVRFLVGGLIVSGFAIAGDLLKPKSFAGLFGAAPSVGLATLVLVLLKQGSQFAAIESRSMVLGAIAFAFYTALASRPVAGISDCMSAVFGLARNCPWAMAVDTQVNHAD